MAYEDIKFPVYRRYRNGKNYFKIINPETFLEIQIIGSKRMLREVTTVQFPEKNFIHELVYHYGQMADVISPEEFEALLESAE